MHPTESNQAITDPPQSDKHFLFRCEQSWFSVPAVAVREVSVAPEFVTVPGCDEAVEGLCRQQSEFIPVISLGALLDLDRCDQRQENNQLLTLSTGAVWAIRIAEAAALEALETIPSQDFGRGDVVTSPVIGTAGFGEHVVRVLNPDRLYERTHQMLERQWNGSQVGPIQAHPLLGNER
jgi:chemotaxis signal transduction protein